MTTIKNKVISGIRVYKQPRVLSIWLFICCYSKRLTSLRSTVMTDPGSSNTTEKVLKDLMECVVSLKDDVNELRQKKIYYANYNHNLMLPNRLKSSIVMHAPIKQLLYRMSYCQVINYCCYHQTHTCFSKC